MIFIVFQNIYIFIYIRGTQVGGMLQLTVALLRCCYLPRARLRCNSAVSLV